MHQHDGYQSCIVDLHARYLVLLDQMSPGWIKSGSFLEPGKESFESRKKVFDIGRLQAETVFLNRPGRSVPKLDAVLWGNPEGLACSMQGGQRPANLGMLRIPPVREAEKDVGVEEVRHAQRRSR